MTAEERLAVIHNIWAVIGPDLDPEDPQGGSLINWENLRPAQREVLVILKHLIMDKE